MSMRIVSRTRLARLRQHLHREGALHLQQQHRAITGASRLKGFDNPTFWAEFSAMAVKEGSVNLGQGFPNWETPSFVRDALSKATQADFNQYTRPSGDPDLVSALADHYSPLVGRKIDPMTEIVTSVGATEALFALMQAYLNPGDEVILIEPCFDIYAAQVQMAGGKCKAASLELVGGEWKLDMDKLESLITDKTKVLLMNTPQNPTGKIFSKSELEDVASILRRHPHVTAVMDEVYEHLVFDGNSHVRLASLPDMWERTLTVSSVGKTFSCTGWKAGWVYGGAEIIKPIALANQWIIYCLSTPISKGVAEILRKAEGEYMGHATYYEYICSEFQRKKDFLHSILQEANLQPLQPEGGYFVNTHLGDYAVDQKYSLEPGLDGTSPVSQEYAFARWMTHEYGVTPIPYSAFYNPGSEHKPLPLGKFRPHHQTSWSFKSLILIQKLTIFSTNLSICAIFISLPYHHVITKSASLSARQMRASKRHSPEC